MTNGGRTVGIRTGPGYHPQGHPMANVTHYPAEILTAPTFMNHFTSTGRTTMNKRQKQTVYVTPANNNDPNKPFKLSKPDMSQIYHPPDYKHKFELEETLESALRQVKESQDKTNKPLQWATAPHQARRAAEEAELKALVKGVDEAKDKARIERLLLAGYSYEDIQEMLSKELRREVKKA